MQQHQQQHPSPARALPGLPFPLAKALERAQEPPVVVAALNDYRSAQPPPYQSHFRVLALAVFEDATGAVGCVVGANNESCALANSLCGERAALAQLRLLPHQPVALLRMYVVTDDAKPLFPGMLCREFLSSVGGPEVPIVVAGAKGDDIRVATLGELYPFASIYRHVDRRGLLDAGAAFKASDGGLELPQHPQALQLYNAVVAATGRDDRDHLHPIRYAAGVFFADGSSSLSWQKKGIEYGTTIDACASLAQALEEEAEDDGEGGRRRRRPVVLIQADQFGICHAPFGAARAFLKEYGHSELVCLVHHRSEEGRVVLRSVTVRELTPAEPVIEFKN